MGTATPPGTEERRREPRRQPTLGTTCRLMPPSGPSVVGLVWNISTKGVSMLVDRRLEPGTTLPVELLDASQTYALPLEVRVAHAAPLRTGDYVMGGAFARQLHFEEIRPFLIGS